MMIIMMSNDDSDLVGLGAQLEIDLLLPGWVQDPVQQLSNCLGQAIRVPAPQLK